MELQFQNSPLRCLRCSASGNTEAEQTLELRIGEGKPPVGRVLGAWGQPLIRGKEWRGDQVRVHGGVMARVLYEGEDSEEIHAVEGWLPFQLRWDLTDSRTDGKMVLSCCVRSMDARQIGAEKLMVRTSVSANLQALEREEIPVFSPQSIPEDVFVKMENWSAMLPMEAGEIALTLDEEIILPPGKAEVENILFYSLTPHISDKKVVADKLVFRGTAELCMVYLGGDGQVHMYRTELPISQYGELEREYGPDAILWIEPMVADLELEKMEDGRLRLKASLVGQYVIYDKTQVCAVQDAYSPKRDVQPIFQQVRLPSVLEHRTETLPLHQTVEEQADRVVCSLVSTGQPRVQGGETVVEGATQTLYYDPEGKLQCATSPFEESLAFSAPNGAVLSAGMVGTGNAEAVPGGGSMRVQSDMELWLRAVQGEALSMVSGLTVGEERKPDPDRPSLVLRRAGGMKLWDLAKKYGSSEEKIRMANALTEEPEGSRMLLIPVE